MSSKRKSAPPLAKRPRHTQSGPHSAEGSHFPPIVDVSPDWQFPEPGSPRGKILAAARELFAEQGLEATSIRDITEKAGVNSAMAHYYFQNKEVLYRRVLGLEMLTVFQTIRAQIEADISPGELIVSIPVRVMRVVRDNPVWAKLLSREMSSGAAHLYHVVSELKDAGPLGIRHHAEKIYKRALQQGQVRDLPALNVIQFLLLVGYSGVFFDPFFRIIGGGDPNENRAFNSRLNTFDSLLRHGLLTK